MTNQEQCVLGVVDESCIIINVIRNPDDAGIIAIQDSTKEISSIYIDKINQVFDTNAKFHSVFLHSDDESNKALETSGIISGRGMISAVYTLPMEDTSSMYEKISGILLPKIIRDSGGFYDVAKKLSTDENSKMTFSLDSIRFKITITTKIISRLSKQSIRHFRCQSIRLSQYRKSTKIRLFQYWILSTKLNYPSCRFIF